MNSWIGGGLAIWAAAIAWKDWQSHRVPNAALVLVLIPALLAVIVNGKGLLDVAAVPSFVGLLLGAGILLPGYALGKMGAGDIKLAACMGLLLGVAILQVLLVFAILVGVLAAVAWWYYREVPDKGRQRIAAAPALAAAFIAHLLLGGMSSWSVF